MPEPPRIGVVLLAAGRGCRFGVEPKLLALCEGVPLVRRAAQAALASRAEPVVAVLGAHAERVHAALHGLDLRCVENRDFADGLAGSLRTGLTALPPEARAAVVMLADMPWIGAHHLDAVCAAFTAAEPRPSAVVPVHAGRRGNPVLIDHHRLAAELAVLTGGHGAGPLLRRRTDVLEIEADRHVARDVDTLDQLSPP